MQPWHDHTQALAVRLTRFFSQTGTAGETGFAPFLRDLLAGWPNFHDRTGDLRLERTQEDPQERYAVLALVRGSGPRTLILTGHYDVVGVENYGALSEWACDPDALLPRLTARLEREEQGDALPPADRLALDDLRTGQFLPGRGLLDMKGGLAAGLVVLERFAQLPPSQRAGNLLFIAVPDEEIASHGARTAAARLPVLAREWGLDLAGVINLDASNEPGDGALGQVAYLGTIGKLLPAVYLVGRETHAGSPFGGVNPNLLAAELTRRIECAPGLAEACDGEVVAPPTCLKQTDTKPYYDVTTPAAAWCAYNWLTLRKPVGEVLETVKDLARQALEAALDTLRQAALEHHRLSGRAAPDGQPGVYTSQVYTPQVYTFAEVKSRVARRGGSGALEQLAAIERPLAAGADLDAPSLCLRLVEAAWKASGLSGPAAVVCFASLAYAPARVDGTGERAVRFRQAVERQVQAVSRLAGTPITVRPFFPGISDISFFSGQMSAGEIEVLSANSPAWESRTGFDYRRLAGLDLPAANIGPWGRDYHQRTERIHAPYSFQVLPELLWQIAGDLLEISPQRHKER